MQWLERKFEEEEVRTTIFAMKGDKAPGPDGYPSGLRNACLKLIFPS